MTYSEQLQTKEWENKRNKIIARDKYCQRCGTKNRLEVHHTYYDFRLKAWEYPDESLITLCRNCHEKETKDIKTLKGTISQMLNEGFFASEIMGKINIKFK